METQTMELQLIKAEKFGEIEADIYSDTNDMFMTSEQLGSCLGYAVPAVGMSKMLAKNEYLKDAEFSVVTKMVSTDGKFYSTRIFNEDGIYEATFIAKQKTLKSLDVGLEELLKLCVKAKSRLLNKTYHSHQRSSRQLLKSVSILNFRCLSQSLIVV